MLKARRFVTAGGTLVCALGIGYLMQSTSQAAPQATKTAKVSSFTIQPLRSLPVEDEIQISDVVLTSAIPSPPEAPPQPAQFSNTPVVLASATADDALVVLPLEEPTPVFECSLDLSATSVAAAMVDLTLSAPCMANERFTVHHNGMMFSEVTDDAGNSTLTVPALTEQSVFIASFASGDGAVASVGVTSLEYYDRVVVQWRGDSGLHVHAREYDAGYGDAGHVWANAAREMSVAASGEGGFLTKLGASDIDNPLLAEVYTFPTGIAARDGDVRLSVEAEVTAANCGRDIEAQMIQIDGDFGLKAKELELAMPNCDAIGDFLVLNNTFNDLKIARN